MERIIFEAPSENPKHTDTPRRLEELPLIKLFPEEKILCVQRQHWLILAQKMVLPVLAICIVFLMFIFLPLQDFSAFVPRFSTIQTYLFLTAICAILLLETYIFMNWYYQFYIITTRCLLHIHFFRIGGFYFDEVFLDKVSQQEIDRHAPNLLCDLLGLYNVCIYFSHIERPEPFIFQTPSDSRAIENILEDLTEEEIERREKRR